MDLLPLVRTYKIVDKARGIVPFNPNWAQMLVLDSIHRQYNAGKPVRSITLKARQMGVSTMTEAAMFSWSFMFHNNRGLIVSHEVDSSQHLLSIPTLYWESCPWGPGGEQLYHTKWMSKNVLHWRENNSAIGVVTAKNLAAGRSKTIHFLHGSEVAFWPDAKTLMTGLSQTIPEGAGTAIILESTANGLGNWFYDQWEAAEQGDNEYDPLFFPFWVHNEYRDAGNLLRPLGQLSEEERILKVLMRTGLTVGRLRYHGLTPENCDAVLRWRRYTIANKLNNDVAKFNQEYPSNPEEAFIATGNNIFPAYDLKIVYKPEPGVRGYLVPSPTGPKFLASPDGPLTIFKHPAPNRDWGKYFVGGDPTWTQKGDPACAQVLNRRNGEQVAVLHKRIGAVEFATDLHLIARYYNDAIISTESSGPGYGTIGALVQMGYPYLWQSTWADKTPGSLSESFGFAQNQQRKWGAIGCLLSQIVEHSVTIHDHKTYHQLRNYVRLDNGQLGPANPNEDNDDAVMALAIARYCDFLEPPLAPYGQGKREDVPWEMWEAGTDMFRQLQELGT